MAKQIINIGSIANDGTGDTIRAGGDKINDNFTELYDADGVLTTAVNGKQATLVSGTNIKTINSNSILGSGDIVISGGATNLSYTAGVSTGVVMSDTGTDATIPLTDATNAGLFSAAQKTKLDGIEALADVTDAANVGAVNAAAASKATPVNADSFPIVDSEATNVIKRLTFTNLKAFLVTYFDTIYQAILVSGTNIKTINGASILGSGDLTVAGSGSGANLGYTAAPTNGTVTSDTGTDATLSLADGTNAGLMAPAQHTKLAGIATGATVYTDEMAQDAVGGILVDGAIVEFAYDDATPAITATIKTESITSNELDITINASLVLADSALQAADITGKADKSAMPVTLTIACSDETTALTTGTAKVTFRMPHAMTLTGVRASVTTAPTGGTLLTVDINETGTTVLSTKLTFDASEKTTTTATTAAVISDSALADDAEITIDIDAVGSTIAGAGLKVTLIGTRSI